MAMSQHEAFLKAIRVEPNDKFHERIYCDYLKDEGYDPPEPYLAIARLLAQYLYSSRQTLSLGRHEKIGKFGVAVIVSCTRLDALREIYLPGKVTNWTLRPRQPQEVEPNIGEDGVVLLVNSPLMEQISTLDLRYNQLSTRAVDALVRSPYLDLVEQLDIDEPYPYLSASDWARLVDHFGDRLRTRPPK
jgi:hypothetical protein